MYIGILRQSGGPGACCHGLKEGFKFLCGVVLWSLFAV